MTECYSSKRIAKTRKSGRCSWCGELIEVGQSAVRDSGKFDGAFFTSRLHPECSSAMNDDPYISQDGYELGSRRRGMIEPR